MNDHVSSINTLGKVIERLACPQCYSPLTVHDSTLKCSKFAHVYPIIDDIVDLRTQSAEERSDIDDWSKHWSAEKQNSLMQRFFSVYRSVVFARTVSYFVERFFPPNGIFLEAGSGTSETSMRINKNHGDRLLVALDIILPVLKESHSVMDLRLCGDIFRIPFSDESIDGLWNVGVMEHFTHEQIDLIMREFHRVLKPGAPILLLWPGDNSIPQKILRVSEAIINYRGSGEKYQFHPDEISKLKSVEEGKEVLSRNGFKAQYVDYGLRSLMAFITPVGVRI